MKKVLYFAALLLTTVFASCEKEEIGGTATQATAGQWYVTIDAVDENGKPIQGGEDYFGLG
ncbi:MAG: lipid-binding protein, partial [Bacteroidales bacterium]